MTATINIAAPGGRITAFEPREAVPSLIARLFPESAVLAAAIAADLASTGRCTVSFGSVRVDMTC